MERDIKYEQNLEDYLKEVLPEKIYDAHFHLSKNGDVDMFEKFRKFTEKMTFRPVNGGLLMTSPSSKHTLEDLESENNYCIDLANKHGLEVGLVISPKNTREEVEKKLDENPVIRALKPYLTYTPEGDMFEADILEYAPEWMWSIANERKMPVILHLSHYQDMLNDERNWKQIRYICEKYPDAKMVLAHCAMGHHVRKLRLGIEHIKDLKNIWIDCSGIAETMSIYYCLKTFGVDRMMYGGDYPFAGVKGRICSFGSNFVGFHSYFDLPDFSGDYHFQPLTIIHEGLVVLLEACDLLGLGRQDLEKIFYDNAVKLFRN